MIVAFEAKGTNTYNRYAMCLAGKFRVNFFGLINLMFLLDKGYY